MYTVQQLEKVWYSVKYKEDRYWAFLTSSGSWRHTDSATSPKKTFDDFEQFYKYVDSIQAQDIHAKMLIDGSREWVIDVDHDEHDEDKIELKNMIAHSTLKTFFGENCTKILYSGNRGLHVWLHCDEFDLKSNQKLRTYYYDTMLKPAKSINKIFIQQNSLNDCFLKSFQNTWIVRNVVKFYPKMDLNNIDCLYKTFFPYIDKQIFVTNKQIRAPYSYNSKGNKYSCDHILLY